MRIKVPVIYDAKVTPKKARNSRTRHFGEWLEFDVREVDDIEAPVALRWADKEFRPNGVNGFCERRWLNGELWEPVLYQYSGRPNEHVTLSTVIDWTAKGTTYSPLVGGPDWKVRQFLEQGKDVPLVLDEYRSVEKSERADAVQQALDSAKGLISVDGMMWKKSYEPVYHAKRSGGFYDTYVSIELTKPDDSRARQGDMFRADRFDDVAAWAQEKWGEEISEDYRIHVLIPECIRYEDEVPALLTGLNEAVSSQTEWIGQHERPSIMAWLDLRDAVNALNSQVTDETLVDAVSAADVWLVVTEAHDYQKKSLEEALDRWNSRPISFASDETAGFGFP